METGVPVASERLLGGEVDIREREYRRERIRQIQAALAKEQEELGGDSFVDDGDAVDTNDAATPEGINAEGMTIEKNEVSGKTGGSMDFCAECALLPPLRAHHCVFCGRCVATFDHHCLLLATCIGEKNHCRFWWFLLLQSVELALAIGVVRVWGSAVALVDCGCALTLNSCTRRLLLVSRRHTPRPGRIRVVRSSR